MQLYPILQARNPRNSSKKELNLRIVMVFCI